MNELDLVLEELGEGVLVPRENATLIEQRAHAMMLDKFAGQSNRQIALRYGVSPDVINDLIRVAINDCLATRRHVEILAELMNRLFTGNEALVDLFNSLPNYSKREFQKLTSAGEIKTLNEDICNIPEKVKILAERRRHVMAIFSLLGADTGELPAEQRDQEIGEILATIHKAAQEVMGDHTQQA